jgi:hypothetical protein
VDTQATTEHSTVSNDDALIHEHGGRVVPGASRVLAAAPDLKSDLRIVMSDEIDQLAHLIECGSRHDDGGGEMQQRAR